MWTFEQWRTWKGDRAAFHKRLKDMGHEVVGTVNGRPLFSKEVDWAEIEAIAQGLDKIEADFPEEDQVEPEIEEIPVAEQPEPEATPEQAPEPKPTPKAKKTAKKRKPRAKKGGSL